MSGPSVALADVVRVLRPEDLGGSIEIVVANPRSRAFPSRVSNTLGVCLKRGPAHRVRADGRWREYPADTICVRPPGCIWSTDDTGPAGFVSIDVCLPPEVDADARTGQMEFAPVHALPDVRALASVLARPISRLAKDEAIATMIVALAERGLLSAPAVHAPTAPARGLRRARELLEASVEDTPSLDEVATAAGMNKHVLVRKFRDQFGATPHKFLVMAKIDRSKELLARGAPISDVAAALGFADQAHFARTFRGQVGVTPRAFQRSVRTLA